MEKFNEILKFVTGKSTRNAVLIFLLVCFLIVYVFVQKVLPLWQSYRSLQADITKQENEYKKLAPLAAKMFIENTKRQLRYLKPDVFKNATEEDFYNN